MLLAKKKHREVGKATQKHSTRITSYLYTSYVQLLFMLNVGLPQSPVSKRRRRRECGRPSKAATAKQQAGSTAERGVPRLDAHTHGHTQGFHVAIRNTQGSSSVYSNISSIMQSIPDTIVCIYDTFNAFQKQSRGDLPYGWSILKINAYWCNIRRRSVLDIVHTAVLVFGRVCTKATGLLCTGSVWGSSSPTPPSYHRKVVTKKGKACLPPVHNHACSPLQPPTLSQRIPLPCACYTPTCRVLP